MAIKEISDLFYNEIKQSSIIMDIYKVNSCKNILNERTMKCIQKKIVGDS